MRAILKRHGFLWITPVLVIVGISWLLQYDTFDRSQVEAAPPPGPRPPAPFTYYLPVIASANAAPTHTAYDWLQFAFDSKHSGSDGLETWITPSDVSGLHRLFQITLPSVADGAPAFLHGIQTNTGVRDLFFVTTKAGHLIALDAHTGAQIWTRQYGPGACISSNGGVCYTTSSPAIDPNRQYV